MSKSKIITTTLLSKGFLKVERLELDTPLLGETGSMHQIREVAKQNDSVFVLPYDRETGEVIVVKQHRAGAVYKNTSLVMEPIAGRIDYKSSPNQIAVNEAEEESGLNLKSEDLESLGEFMSSPGGSTESCHLYLIACDLSNVPTLSHHGLASEGEDIESMKMKISEVEEDQSIKSIQLAMLLNCVKMRLS